MSSSCYNFLGYMDLQHTRPSSRLVTRPFVVAVVLLSAAAVLAGPVANWLQIKHRKQPLRLRSPLAALDADALAPYRVIRRHVLEPAIVEALGTNQYLDWTLEDRSVAADDPLRYVNLFITYDTGGYNLVPHTPDVCRRGAGYQPAQPHENVDLEVPALAETFRAVPSRVCTFAKTDIFSREKVSVVYTFHCNGKFVATRTGVRLLMNELANTYAYFSKVEVSFPKATRAQCVEGAAKLYNRVLPLLVKNHWPDFDAAEKDARQPEPSDRTKE